MAGDEEGPAAGRPPLPPATGAPALGSASWAPPEAEAEAGLALGPPGPAGRPDLRLLLEEAAFQALMEEPLFRRPPAVGRAPSQGEASLLSLPFPEKLWRIVSSEEFTSIWWDEDGACIGINEKLFQKEVLERAGRAKVFQTDSIKSFARQLNLYGFSKTRQDVHTSVCQTSFLHEGRPISILSKVQGRGASGGRGGGTSPGPAGSGARPGVAGELGGSGRRGPAGWLGRALLRVPRAQRTRAGGFWVSALGFSGVCIAAGGGGCWGLPLPGEPFASHQGRWHVSPAAGRLQLRPSGEGEDLEAPGLRVPQLGDEQPPRRGAGRCAHREGPSPGLEGKGGLSWAAAGPVWPWEVLAQSSVRSPRKGARARRWKACLPRSGGAGDSQQGGLVWPPDGPCQSHRAFLPPVRKLPGPALGLVPRVLSGRGQAFPEGEAGARTAACTMERLVHSFSSGPWPSLGLQRGLGAGVRARGPREVAVEAAAATVL